MEIKRTLGMSIVEAGHCVVCIVRRLSRRKRHSKQAVHQVKRFTCDCERPEVWIRIKLKEKIKNCRRALHQCCDSYQFVLDLPRLVCGIIINDKRKSCHVRDVNFRVRAGSTWSCIFNIKNLPEI